jgi:hypothetical protein
MNSAPTTAPVPAAGGPGLEYYEGIMARGLPSYEAVSLALLEIHERKLYSALYGSFQAYVQRRWQFSRARAYQMLHFARLKRLSTMVDITLGPENERQARALDGQGNPRSPEEADPVFRAMRYLVKLFERLPSAERREFIESIGNLLRDFTQEMARQDRQRFDQIQASGPGQNLDAARDPASAEPPAMGAPPNPKFSNAPVPPGAGKE